MRRVELARQALRGYLVARIVNRRDLETDATNARTLGTLPRSSRSLERLRLPRREIILCRLHPSRERRSIGQDEVLQLFLVDRNHQHDGPSPIRDNSGFSRLADLSNNGAKRTPQFAYPD